MQPTQVQLKFVCFLLRMISAALSVSKQNISQFFAGFCWLARPHAHTLNFRSSFVFCWRWPCLHVVISQLFFLVCAVACFPFPVKNGHFLVSLQRASLSEFLDGIWIVKTKIKQKKINNDEYPFSDLFCIYCKVIRVTFRLNVITYVGKYRTFSLRKILCERRESFYRDR